jgi:hypothetical protein
LEGKSGEMLTLDLSVGSSLQDIRFGGRQMPDPGVRAYGSHLNAWKDVDHSTICGFRYMLFRPGRARLYTVEPEE